MIDVRIDGAVAVITLNRPERRNALSLEMMRELRRALQHASGTPEIRAIVLAAEGPAFSAGHDLRELRCGDVHALREIFDACVDLMQTIERVPQPVIAEVATIATAAGCQLVATCDMAIAAEDARFATPGVRIGLFCTTPMVALTRVIGRKRAMQMLMTGDAIDARTAAEWGLVNEVVPAGELRERVLALARKIAEASGFVVELGKRAFYAQIDLDEARAYAYAKEVMTTNALADDAREGMAAFLERRVPMWTSSKTSAL